MKTTGGWTLRKVGDGEGGRDRGSVGGGVAIEKGIWYVWFTGVFKASGKDKTNVRKR